MPVIPDVTASSINSDDPQKQMEAVVKQINDGFRAISNESRTNITKDDAGDQRLLIGYQKDGFDNGNVGAKLSQEGVDVATATDDQLIWSTDFNNFKIVSSGTTSISINGSFPSFVPQTATVAHGLGTTPAFIVYVENPNYDALTAIDTSSAQGLTATPLTVFFKDFVPNVSPLLNISARADSTNLYMDVVNLLTVSSDFPAWTWNFRYYILKETAI